MFLANASILGKRRSDKRLQSKALAPFLSFANYLAYTLQYN